MGRKRKRSNQQKSNQVPGMWTARTNLRRVNTSKGAIQGGGHQQIAPRQHWILKSILRATTYFDVNTMRGSAIVVKAARTNVDCFCYLISPRPYTTALQIYLLE